MLRATSLRPESEREDVGGLPEKVVLVALVWVALLVAEADTAETLSIADRVLDSALVEVLLKVLLIGIFGVKLGVIAGICGSGVERVVAEAKLWSVGVSAKVAANFVSNDCEDSGDRSRSSDEESSPEALSASRTDRLFRVWSPSSADGST